MNSKFKITIPKPCHENWNEMTLKEKGRFCSSCAKTVVDFTKKTTEDIQDYLVENKNKQVCGHFYNKQLDTIVIEIPQITFQQQLSFQKLFILTLFFVMGTSLFSCQYSDGKKQEIKNIVIQDSIEIIKEEIGLNTPTQKKLDSLKLDKEIFIVMEKIDPLTKIKKDSIICKTNTKNTELTYVTTTEGVIEIIETIGELKIEGEIDFVEDDDLIMGIIVEEPPRFKESENLPKQEAKKDFDIRMKRFIEENFDLNSTISLDLKQGKYKIYTQFIIDKKGFVTDIKIRAPYPKLEKKVLRIFKKFPQFIPGRQRNKTVKTKYNLPISFEIE